MVTTTAAAILIIHLIRRDKCRKGKLTQVFKSPTLSELFRYVRCGMNLRWELIQKSEHWWCDYKTRGNLSAIPILMKQQYTDYCASSSLSKKKKKNLFLWWKTECILLPAEWWHGGWMWGCNHRGGYVVACSTITWQNRGLRFHRSWCRRHWL